MNSNEEFLAHYGVLGMKWGVRRYQNPDGTLTAEGRARYLNPDGSLNALGRKELGSRYRRSTTGNTEGVNQKKNAVFNKEYDPDRMMRAGLKAAGYTALTVAAARSIMTTSGPVTMAFVTGAAGYKAIRNGQTFCHELGLRNKEKKGG